MSDLSKSNTLGSKFSLAMVPLYLILRFVIHLVFTELNVNIKKICGYYIVNVSLLHFPPMASTVALHKPFVFNPRRKTENSCLLTINHTPLTVAIINVVFKCSRSRTQRNNLRASKCDDKNLYLVTKPLSLN